MRFKPATHVAPAKPEDIKIRACPLGGFEVMVGPFHEGYLTQSVAAFSTPTETADYVRSLLMNIQHERFGAKKKP